MVRLNEGKTPLRLDLALKRQAISCLARREHSVQELRTRLRRWAIDRQAAWAGVPEEAAEPDKPAKAPKTMPTQMDPAPPTGETCPSPDLDGLIEQVLDDLRRQGLLSDERFVGSRLHLRQARFGNRRIEGELRQHGIRLDAETRAALAQSEAQRAQAVLQRRFDGPPADAAAAARRRRFLAARGFGAEAIQVALKVTGTAAGFGDAAPAVDDEGDSGFPPRFAED